MVDECDPKSGSTKAANTLRQRVAESDAVLDAVAHFDEIRLLDHDVAVQLLVELCDIKFSTFEKHLLCDFCCRALLCWFGASGVEGILRLALKADSPTSRKTALGTIMLAAQRDLHPVREATEGARKRFRDLGLDEVPDAEVARSAGTALSRFMSIASSSDDAIMTLSQYLHLQSFVGAATDEGERTIRLFRLALSHSLALSPDVISSYDELIRRQEREEEYQSFLAQHPSLLDPLAMEVIPKQRLGLEYATDYALKRLDGRWILIEIEKPQDRIFVRSGDFSKDFFHAYRQAIDFLSWVDENVAYACRAMPGIVSPTAMVVIGTRETLDEDGKRRLRAFNSLNRRVEVRAFDDLSDQARLISSNIHHRAPPDWDL